MIQRICFKFMLVATLVAMMSTTAPASDKCTDDAETWLEVEVKGFKDRTGNIAVEIHPDQQGDFMSVLVSRERLKTPEEDPTVCVVLPGPGSYILVVLHDRNEDQKLSILSDGFGFSRNPTIGLGLPKRDEIYFDATPGQNRQTVILNYVQGLTARPIDQKHEARQSRRRRLH